jgi:predicted MarR family transcription regulator
MTRAENDIMQFMRGAYTCWSPQNSKIAFLCQNTMEGAMHRVRRRTLEHLEELGLLTTTGNAAEDTTWVLTERGSRI